jgi:hypothetical protein
MPEAVDALGLVRAEFRHYAEFRTMPSKSRLTQRQREMTRVARVRVVDGLGIVQRTATGF